MAKGGNWIKGSIKRPGRLRRVLGAKKGQPIPESKLKAAAAGKDGKLTAQEAREAITLKKLRRRKGKKK